MAVIFSQKFKSLKKLMDEPYKYLKCTRIIAKMKYEES